MRATRPLAFIILAACTPAPQVNGPSPDLAQPVVAADLSAQASVDQAMPATVDLAQATVGATVLLKDDFYMPNMITIAAGQKVKWTWQAAGAHGVNSVDDAFPDSPILNAGNTGYEHTFTTPGTYQVNCAVHGTQMPMTIIVQ